jgi:hypothetical protein
LFEVKKVNEDMRGQIERALDKAVKSLDVEDSVGWIWDEQKISSFEDLALGYVLGYIACTAHNIIFQGKVWKKTEEHYEKAVGKKLEIDKTQKIDVKLTPKEIDEIREMLKRRIQNIMEAIVQGRNR